MICYEKKMEEWISVKKMEEWIINGVFMNLNNINIYFLCIVFIYY